MVHLELLQARFESRWDVIDVVSYLGRHVELGSRGTRLLDSKAHLGLGVIIYTCSQRRKKKSKRRKK